MIPQGYTEINLFRGEPLVSYLQNRINLAKQEVNHTSKLVLSNDVDFSGALYDKYFLSALMVHQNNDNRNVEQLSNEVLTDQDEFGETYEQPVMRFLVSFGFTGSSELFSLQPSIISLNNYSGRFFVSTIYNRIGYVIKIKVNTPLDANTFENTVKDIFKRLFDRIGDVNRSVGSFNSELNMIINDTIREKRTELNEVDKFLSQLNSRK